MVDGEILIEFYAVKGKKRHTVWVKNCALASSEIAVIYYTGG